MKLDFLEILLPMLFKGLKWTMIIAVLGILFGFIIGALAGFALQSQNKVAKGIANVYIWIVRGIPLMVLAMWIYYVIPKLTGVRLSSETAGVITITLNSGAFISELVRGALAGIDPGQREAGLALGLSNIQTLFHIIVPPAFRTMLPGLFNQFIISVKDTAMLSVIVVNEITKQIQNYAALSFKTIQAYTTGAVFYLVLIYILILAQKWIERKMAN